ncbi:hypothetical protein A0H81_05763 [Grifola frondosa]|uniref:DUF6534 domain-containing protein n=1 Tax=Grifola frondosa TaxID=5627 RepID=A0A1C7MD89_GRIFR|nr:hypothetical protein A0H81_05763 [Grifola frondosa]
MSSPIFEVNLSDSMGSMLVGQFLACVLWGINCVQLFWYFSIYAADSISMKTLVICLWIMDTLDHILMLQGIWNPLIAHWGNPVELTKLLPADTHHVWASAIVSFSVQLFFIRRVHLLNEKKLLWSLILAILAVYQLCIAIVYPVLAFKHGTLEYLGTPVILALQISDRACTVITDVSISVSIVWLLLQKGIPKWTSSRQMFVRILIVTINTNMWTALVALIDFCVMPVSSLYMASFLGNLNARRFVNKESTTINEFMSVLPDEIIDRGRDPSLVVFRNPSGGSTTVTDPENGIPMIKIERSQITQTDTNSVDLKSGSN